MGLSARGINCLDTAFVLGPTLEPTPPASIIPLFITI